MIRKILYTITILTVLLLGYLIFNFIKFSYKQDNLAYIKGAQTTADLKKKINTSLKVVMNEGIVLKKLLENNEFSSNELEAIIKKRAFQLPTILGVTVAYEPYSFSSSTKLYAPYYDKNQNKLIQIGDLYDYTNPLLETSSWYVNVEKKGAHWVEPYYAQGAQALVSDYSIPFYYTKGPKKEQYRGVVSMTISLIGFTDMIHSISLGKTGFGFVTSQKGKLLAHPINEYVGLKNITDLIKEEKNNDLKNAYQNILEHKAGKITYNDALKKQKALFFYDNVPISNWKIAVQFFKNDLLKTQELFKRKYINISITTSLLFLLLLANFYNRDHLSTSEIWYLSLFSTTILLANIFLIGYLQHTKADVNVRNESPPITNKTALNSIVNTQLYKAKKLAKPSKRVVPTGIYVERLEFNDSYNVNISGIIWQKYHNDFAKTVKKGFKFPQIAPFAESSFIEETYRKQQKNHLLIGYNFRTTIRLNFDYSDYPFDKRNIDLEIQPIKNDDNLLLVPDLKSYTYTNPLQKSGISNKIKLPGSKILETYFNYSFYTYATNFGFKDNTNFEDTPILHFNINVREVLITAFVTYLIPIFVTLIMIFIFIYSTPRSKNGRINGGAIVQGMAAFFFVLIFSHIDLRKNIETADLIYMEYFYFVTYIIIVLATYNLITFSRIPNKLFDFKDNLIVKASYWPLFLFLVLAITLFNFY